MGASMGFTAPGDSIQRQQRSYRTFTDQHGRTFEAIVDVRNGMPIGEFTPKGCTPPWLPSMRWAKFRKEHDVTFAWDYEPLAAEVAGAANQYYNDATQIAIDNNIDVPEPGGPVDRKIRAVLGRPPESPMIALAAQAGDPWILGIPGAEDRLGLKAVLEQGTTANGKELMATIQTMIRARVTERNVETVPEVPRAPEQVEKARSIHDVDTSDPIAPVSYKDFYAACKKRNMAHADIIAAWHEQKLLQTTE